MHFSQYCLPACWLLLGACLPTAAQEARHSSTSAPLTLASSAPGSKMRKSSSDMLPAKVLPPVNAYLVGLGDILNVLVWHEKDLSVTVTVRPDGRITVPLIGELDVVGLSPIQIQSLLADRLTTFVVNPQVNVTVAEVRSRMVYITGEVTHPGAYPLTNSLNALQLIAMAGGLTSFAHHKKLKVIQPGVSSAIAVFDYKDLTNPTTLSRMVPLHPGDTVIVP